MTIYEAVKANVSLREAAQLYGIEVSRYGKALCPFHDDRHPSLFIADDHYHCFACGEHGDVIDFTAKLFALTPYDAAVKLAADFHLNPDKPPTAAALRAKRINGNAQKLSKQEQLCVLVLSDYRDHLERWKRIYAPQTSDEPIHVLFAEACHKLNYVEYLLDVLTFGTTYERQELVKDWLTNNRIYALEYRMAELRKEENRGRDKYRDNNDAA